jgi:hypothetical protein
MVTTWEAIASDVLALSEGTIGKDEVVEFVLDADRLEMYGNLPEEKLKAFRALSYYDQMELAMAAFPYDEYGY